MCRGLQEALAFRFPFIINKPVLQQPLVLYIGFVSLRCCVIFSDKKDGELEHILKVHISANTSTALHIIGIFQRNICAFWNCSASTAVSNFSDSNLSTCHSSFLQIADLKRTELKWQGRQNHTRSTSNGRDWIGLREP